MFFLAARTSSRKRTFSESGSAETALEKSDKKHTELNQMHCV